MAICPNEELVFEVELLDIMNEDASKPLETNLSEIKAADSSIDYGALVTDSSKEDGKQSLVVDSETGEKGTPDDHLRLVSSVAGHGIFFL